jgi:hypothetical protein
VEWLKVKALSSSLVPQKQTNKNTVEQYGMEQKGKEE